MSDGYFLPECWKTDPDDLVPFKGLILPERNVRTFWFHIGEVRPVWSDNFYLYYDDPCGNQPRTGPIQSAFGLEWHKGGIGGRVANPNPGPGEPIGGGGLPHGDGKVKDEYTKTPEKPSTPVQPFVAGQCKPFENPDSRKPTDLPPAESIEFVSEIIQFAHDKNGFDAYTEPPNPETPPRRFLQEDIATSLSGGNPESEVGGELVQRICKMDGDLIVVSKSGNPSYHGTRPPTNPNAQIDETHYDGSFEVQSYDDPPNQQDDTPGVMHAIASLSDEYTTDKVKQDTFEHAWEFKGIYEKSEPTAHLLLPKNELYVDYAKTKYKIRIPAGVSLPYDAVWVEEFTPEDPNPNDEIKPQKEYHGKSERIYGEESKAHTIDPSESPNKLGTWRVYMIQMNLAVDANRDGYIEQGSSDKTTKEKPFWFWSNNDRDVEHVVDSNDHEKDDIPPDYNDYSEPGLTCTRDLEDLTRIRLDLSNFLHEFGSVDNDINLKISYEDAGGGTINLFRIFRDTAAPPYLEETDQAIELNYLEFEPTAEEQIKGNYGSGIANMVGATPETIDQSWVSDLKHNCIDFFFEGGIIGSGKVVLKIYKGNELLASSVPVFLKISKVEEMYETWTAGEPSDDSYGVSDIWPASTSTQLFGEHLPSPLTDEEKDYIIFVHGWNMAPWEKKVFADTMFKRLWHHGYKGRFAAYRWPTFHGFPVPPNQALPDETFSLAHFDASEQRAWNSSEALCELINKRKSLFSIGGKSRVSLYGHSMGNIVCAEALRSLRSKSSVNVYIAAQAALCSHCWDQNTPIMHSMQIGSVSLSLDVEPDVYKHYWENGGSDAPYAWSDAGTSSYLDPVYMPSNMAYINHFNPNDWALNGTNWQLNQRLKPDYGYNFAPNVSDFYSSFNRKENGLPRELKAPEDRREMFAYAAPARSYATGQEGDTRGMFSTSVDLNSSFGFGGAHKGHSAQFRSDIQSRWEYWERFLLDVDSLSHGQN